MTDPSKLRNSLQPGGKKSGTPVMLATRLSAAVPGDDDVSDDQSDEFSEGEITSSVTISALLSKLDSVRVRTHLAFTRHVADRYDVNNLLELPQGSRVAAQEI